MQCLFDDLMPNLESKINTGTSYVVNFISFYMQRAANLFHCFDFNSTLKCWSFLVTSRMKDYIIKVLMKGKT